MRNTKRISKILNIIKELWEKYPDQRFLQLISNIKFNNKDPFFIEDEDLFKIIKEHLNED
jgi:hypothetical protein